jgi:hypothetical protein
VAKEQDKLKAKKNETIEKMERVKAAFEQIRDNEEKIEIYKIKANDLDDQIRAAVDDTDILKFIYEGDISFRRFQGYLTFVCLLVYAFCEMTTPELIDVKLMKIVDQKAGFANKKYCEVEQAEALYSKPI